jgi:hypothetical protein
MNKIEPSTIATLASLLQQIEVEFNELDLKTLEGVEELEGLCNLYATAYVLKLRATK